MNKTVCIGVDQSYDRSGIGVAYNGELKKCYSLKNRCKNKIDYRKQLSDEVKKIILWIRKRFKGKCEIVILVEKIRTFNQSQGGFGLNPNYLIETGKLHSAVMDTAYQMGVMTYACDTRSWKSKVLGTSKTPSRFSNEIKPEKMLAITFIEGLGFNCKTLLKDGSYKTSPRGKNKGKVMYDDDMADGGCISLYWFKPDKIVHLISI